MAGPLGVLTLELDLVLNDEGLALIVNLLGELGRYGVVGGCVLYNQTFVTLHALVNMGLLDSPFSDVGPFLIFLLGVFVILLGVGWLPSGLPIVCELLDEIGLD